MSGEDGKREYGVKRVSIPQTVLVGMLSLVVGGGTGGVIAPWRVQESIDALRSEVSRNSIKAAELNIQVAALNGLVRDLKLELRDLRNSRTTRSRGVSMASDRLANDMPAEERLRILAPEEPAEDGG